VAKNYEVFARKFELKINLGWNRQIVNGKKIRDYDMCICDMYKCDIFNPICGWILKFWALL